MSSNYSPPQGAGGGGASSFSDLSDITIVTKSSDEILVGPNTTDQNDDELFFPMEINSIYEIEVLMLFTSSTIADFKGSASIPSGARGVEHTDNGLGYNQLATAGYLGVGTGAGLFNVTYLRHVIIQTGGTAGNYQVKWSQNVGEASNTTVLANSQLIVRKIA